jgi:hypothetical protein
LTDTRAVPGMGPVAVTDRRLPELVGNPVLDRLAALAARILGAPSGQVTLLTDLPTDAGAPGPEGDLAHQAAAAMGHRPQDSRTTSQPDGHPGRQVRVTHDDTLSDSAGSHAPPVGGITGG